MACYAIKAIQIAKAEDGYKEGKNNWNKYADALDKTDMYNFPKQNIPYCDIFFDWSIWEACDRNTDEARYVLCQPKKSAGAGCKYSYGYYKKAGRVGKEPKLGAQVFFGSTEDDIYHTGIVIGIKNGKVITEEGNSGNEVKQHTYTLGAKNSKIFGYGYPRYAEEDQEKPEPTPEHTVPISLTDEEITAIAKQVMEGKYGNDPERKAKLVYLYGEYGRSKIQARVNELIAAEKKPSSSEKPSGSIYKVKTFTGAPLRLRAKPDTKSKVLALMKNGSTIEVESINNGWAKVKYHGITGYCTSNRIAKK